MTSIKFQRDLTARAHPVLVHREAGPPLVLRLSGMATHASLGALPRSVPRGVGAAPASTPTHIARVAPSAVAMQAPWSVHSMAAAVQELPDALRGVLIRGAWSVLGPRLASLALPTVTLAAMLYSPSVGDASLPFVPMNPKGRADVEGFDPLGPHDPVQQGVPHTEYTRPDTPMIREHPISANAEIEVHGGGNPVHLAPVPGKAQEPPHWADGIHLATEKAPDPVAYSDSNPVQPQKEGLKFTNVVVSEQKVRVGDDDDGFWVPDKQLHLNFQTSAYGKGEISVRWPNPLDRSVVLVDFKKTSQLPDGPAGEILAHALGYTYGFIPKSSLQLNIENVDTHTPASKDSVAAVMRWAVAMHGRKVSSIGLLDSGYTMSSIGAGFRAAPRFFEKPNTRSGRSADGSRLGDPEIFVNLYGGREPRSTDRLPQGVFLAQDLTAAVHRRRDGLPEEMPFIYVIPVPVHAEDLAPPRIGLVDVYHGEMAQGRSAFGAGVGLAVYDPHFGAGGKYRAQFLSDPTGQFAVQGKKAKRASETALQNNLDTEGRWYSSQTPVSIEPFAGLQVRRESSATSPTRYVIKIPDARALSYQGGPLQQVQARYADLASMVIEPVEQQAGQLPLARVSEVALNDDMRAFLPTFVGQALAAVQLTHPVTGTERAFGGLLGSQEILSNAHLEEFAEGLTVYGLEKQLGMYSPKVPFVLQRTTESGDIELTINPAVRTSR